MEELFRKFCHCYIAEGTKEELEELKKIAKKDFAIYQKKALKFVKNLKRKTQKLGFNTDFESFCNMLEDYINKKDNLSDEDKKNYLKNLVSLSEIYDVNLREELERYVSYKTVEEPEYNEEAIDQKEIFAEFCRYNLNPETDVEDFNKLKQLALNNNLDFKELHQKAIIFVEEIKLLTEKIGFDTELSSVYKMIKEYQNKKNKMTDTEKASYLRILLYLSELYKLNLRELLTNGSKKQLHSATDNKKNQLDDLSNPLDNQELLKKMINQRYSNGQFEIRKIDIENQNYKETNYDYLKLQAALTYRLYSIFLDKFNNYAYEDLNPQYTNLITEEDISILSELTEEELYDILNELSNHESSHYICKKYKLTDNLYNFINLSLTETTDLMAPHIGSYNKTIFSTNNEESQICIYFNGPDYETILFLSEYIKKCVENNLNYNMIGLSSEPQTNEKTILYASNNDLLEKLNIIKTISKNHPEWFENFSNPTPMSTRINNSFYGLSHNGLIDLNGENHISYNDYINNISEIAYYRVLAKIVISKITTEKAKNIINNFISLSNISFNKLKINDLLLASYNGINFTTIKDLINQYIPLVSSTISIYIEDEKQNNLMLNEFKKALLYLSNITLNKDKKSLTNIAINDSILEELKKYNN